MSPLMLTSPPYGTPWSIILDPVQEDPDNAELELVGRVSRDGIFVTELAFPRAEVERGLVQSPDVEGEPVGSRHAKNRLIPMKLRVKADNSSDPFDVLRATLTRKLEKIDDRGGTMRVTPPGYAAITYDLDGVDWDQEEHRAGGKAEFTVTFLARPYGREDPIVKSLHVEATKPCLIFEELAAIPGDVDALGRLQVGAEDNQMFVQWAIQVEGYDAAPTAELFYEAEDLTALGASSKVPGASFPSGAGANKVIRNSELIPVWQALMSTQLAGGDHLSHVGTFSVWARTRRPSSNTGEVGICLEWGEGDLLRRVRNDIVTFAVSERESAMVHVPLGLVTLREVAAGTQQWEGRVLGRSTIAGDELDVDCLYFFPVNEGYGEERGLYLFETPSLFVARDEFEQTPGVLTGKTAPIGGNWAGAGDATDFSVVGGSQNETGTIHRTAVSDADVDTGRFAISGAAALDSQIVQADVKRDTDPGNPGGSAIYQGILARYINSTNWVMAVIETFRASPLFSQIEVRKSVAGAVTSLGIWPLIVAKNDYWTIRLSVGDSGLWLCWAALRGADLGDPLLIGSDSDLETGGALDVGKPGIYDACDSASGGDRHYDNFVAFAPDADDAAIYADQLLEVRSDRVVRQDAAGDLWPDVTSHFGDYLRIPPSGEEERDLRVIVKTSRNDPALSTDPAIDPLSGQLIITPRWAGFPD